MLLCGILPSHIRVTPAPEALSSGQYDQRELKLTYCPDPTAPSSTIPLSVSTKSLRLVHVSEIAATEMSNPNIPRRMFPRLVSLLLSDSEKFSARRRNNLSFVPLAMALEKGEPTHVSAFLSRNAVLAILFAAFFARSACTASVLAASFPGLEGVA